MINHQHYFLSSIELQRELKLGKTLFWPFSLIEVYISVYQ